MAQLSSSHGYLSLVRSFKRLNAADPLTACLIPRLGRQYATLTSFPPNESIEKLPSNHNTTDPPSVLDGSDHLSENASSSTVVRTNPVKKTHVLTTLFSWPDLEPRNFVWYHANQLDMPLRRDILHRAVVFEGDATRQGTASTKWRKDVHGSGRKIIPQKGTGKARAGDKKSPIRRGGGVAFGPHPRDFSTGLQRKVYDIAWRTALSHRYREGEMVVLDDDITIPPLASGRLLSTILQANNWGKGCGRSLLVTKAIDQLLFEEMKGVGEHGLVKDVEDVDVKDLLETGRIVIEKGALNTLLAAHSSDLGLKLTLNAARNYPEDQIQHVQL